MESTPNWIIASPYLNPCLFFCETISFQQVIITKVLRPNRMTDNSLDECYPLSVSYRVEEKRVFFYCMQILVEWNVESKAFTTESRAHNGRLRLSFVQPAVGFPVVRKPTSRRLSCCTIAYHLPLRGFFLLLFLYSFSLSFIFFFGLRDLTNKTRNQKSRRLFVSPCHSVQVGSLCSPMGTLIRVYVEILHV
jgi:hypothetical protein